MDNAYHINYHVSHQLNKQETTSNSHYSARHQPEQTTMTTFFQIMLKSSTAEIYWTSHHFLINQKVEKTKSHAHTQKRELMKIWKNPISVHHK